jgi:hypothetical protein
VVLESFQSWYSKGWKNNQKEEPKKWSYKSFLILISTVHMSHNWCTTCSNSPTTTPPQDNSHLTTRPNSTAPRIQLSNTTNNATWW